jgi:hypothetical protein
VSGRADPISATAAGLEGDQKSYRQARTRFRSRRLVYRRPK